MIYVGCDVGKDGSIVAMDMDGRFLLKSGIPKEKDPLDNYPKLFAIFKQLQVLNGFNKDIIVVIEDVHSLYGMSAKSNFSFGGIKHAKIMACVALDYEYHLVQPKNWQKAMWLPEDVVLKPNGRTKDTKATSLNAAKRMWPDEDFRKTDRSKVPHDGIIDGALMAEYCRMINKNI